MFTFDQGFVGGRCTAESFRCVRLTPISGYVSASQGRRLPAGLVIAAAGRRMTAEALAAMADLGVGEGAWCVLYAVATAGPDVALVDVARRTGLSPSAVMAISDRLAKRGWLERVRATTDHRRVVLTMRAAGYAVLDAGLARCEAAFAAVQGRDARECDELKRLLAGGGEPGVDGLPAAGCRDADVVGRRVPA